MSKILITGSKGFIGKRLKIFLKEQEHSVSEYNLDVVKPINFKGDVDVVVHLAAKTSSQESIKNPLETFRVNFIGTLNVLEFAKGKNIKVIFPSTSGVYKQEDNPVTEDSELMPFNPYVESKYLADELCRFYARVNSVKCIVLRIFNVYGAPTRDWTLMQTIMQDLLDGRESELSSPDNVRDYVHLDDVMSAFEAAINYSSKSNFEIFNIGSGIGYSVKQIVAILSKEFGNGAKVKYTSFREGELKCIVADISKAKKILKWEPNVSINDGIRRMINEYKNN